MFTSKVGMDDSKLLQESNLTARLPQRMPHHSIQAIASEGLAQGPYMAARGGVEPTTFRTEGTEHHHSAAPRPIILTLSFVLTFILALSFAKITKIVERNSSNRFSVSYIAFIFTVS